LFGGYLAKQESIELEGLVKEVLPGQKFRVELQNGHMVLAYAAGKMSKFKIRVMVGDRVTLQFSPYDLSRARITYRHKAVGGGGSAPFSR
jgi:translation initiation factor IF-1